MISGENPTKYQRSHRVIQAVRRASVKTRDHRDTLRLDVHGLNACSILYNSHNFLPYTRRCHRVKSCGLENRRPHLLRTQLSSRRSRLACRMGRYAMVSTCFEQHTHKYELYTTTLTQDMHGVARGKLWMHVNNPFLRCSLGCRCAARFCLV